ncbi:STAS domain-containing protein [Kitasatospora sp. NPDC018058]|uniref:STAS domain-containing protein n=1 Tax=Kitasatospora sp. NPDC018058 TaxID=3364025 RepID=UPI0037BF3DFF
MIAGTAPCRPDRTGSAPCRGQPRNPIRTRGTTGRVDLAELRFCDSTGLNLLLHARLDAETAGIRLEPVGLRPIVAELLAITGAGSALRSHPDLGSALKLPGPAPDFAGGIEEAGHVLLQGRPAAGPRPDVGGWTDQTARAQRQRGSRAAQP